MNEKLWSLEYSPQQKSFHIARIKTILETNLNMLIRGEIPQYFIIAVDENVENLYSLSSRLESDNPKLFHQFKMEEFI